ncbi:MAG: AI-2E family transporter [Eubacteriales bacterium]|nr:AI-2E family transporter [Eubacteriales bacterium]
MRRRFRWDKKYLYWGVTAFCVIAASILFYLIISSFPIIAKGVSKIFSILSPFIWGIVITYLLSPVMHGLERLFSGGKKSGAVNSSRKAKTSRVFAVLISEILLILLIVAFVYLIIPQLYSSIETIVVNSPAYFNKAIDWIRVKLADYPRAEEYVISSLENLSQNLIEAIRDKVLPSLGNVVTGVTTGVFVVVKGVYNLIIGIIVSIYLLANVEVALGGCRKVLYSIFPVESAENIRSSLKFVDKTFMDFIVGKLLDSAIIGLICYIVCALINIPYALLVSVIVGITNIIPFFGPFIGAIPSALIILLVDPVKCLIFIIFIIILQQIDGNIIGPKILGSSVGVNGFWIMFAIIIGGGLFGFTGMLLGVPLFVVFYTAIKNVVERTLKKNDLPVEIESYKNLDYIDTATREIHTK